MKQDPLHITKSINTYLRQHDLSDVEGKRVSGELETVFERLLGKQYRETDFQGKNRFNIPERTAEFFGYMDYYTRSGRTWAAILQAAHAEQSGTIADLCCGWSPKVLLGCCYAHTGGTVSLIDCDAQSLELLLHFSRIFDPPFSIQTEARDVLEFPGGPYSCVIGNHVFDDLLLQSHCSIHGLDAGRIYREEGFTADCWASILRESDNEKKSAEDSLFFVLSSIVEPRGLLCLSQYRSLFEELLHLDDAVQYCRKMLDAIHRRLLASGFVDESAAPRTALADVPETIFLPEELVVLRRM